MANTVRPPTKRVLVISNDSTVFLKNGFVSAFEMFGGRLTEVKNLVARLNDVCDICRKGWSRSSSRHLPSQ